MSFEPSNAGAQLIAQSFGISEGYQNLYARAEAIKQSQAQFEQQQKLWAGQQTLQALDIRSKNLQLQEQTNQLELQSKQLQNTQLDLEAKKRQATAEIDENTAFEKQLSEFPAMARTFSGIADNDVKALSEAKARVLSQFSAYANNPKFASRVQQAVGPALTALGDRLTAATGLLEATANEKLFDLNAVLTAGDPKILSQLLTDPTVRRAALSPGEAGKALRDTVLKATAELMSRQTKIDEKAAEFSGKKAAEQAKETSTRSVPGFSGLGRSAEQAGKFAESYATFKSSADMLDQLIGITQDASAFDKLLPTDLAAKANALSTLITAENKTKIVGPGAVSESEWEILRSLVANPTKLKNVVFRQQAVSSLETLKETLAKKIRNEAEVNGFSPEPGNPLFKGAADAKVPKAGDPFTATIQGKQVQGTWAEQNGRQGLLTPDGLFYPARL